MFPGPLVAFYEIVKAGSIRKASENLQLAPSSVSRQIAILERQMGTELIKRSARGVILTHAGTLVAEFSKSVILDYDFLRSDLNELRGSRRHLIRLAMVESIISGGPIQAIAAFQKDFDSVTFQVSQVPAPAVTEMVLAGNADMGLVFSPGPHPELAVLGSVPEPVVAVFPWKEGQAQGETISLPELVRLPLALADPNFGFRQVFERACRVAAVTPVAIMQSNSFQAIREFVRSGGGVGILPRGAAAEDEKLKRVKTVRILHPEFNATSIDLIILRRRRRSRVLSLFSKVLLDKIR